MRLSLISNQKVLISEIQFNAKLMPEIQALSNAIGKLSTGHVEFAIRDLRKVQRHLDKLADKYDVDCSDGSVDETEERW